ncbi:MAG: hypothetical protein ACOX6T_02425 [Myxococcales bacterium]|jgi:ASC-1-like (ASCH) protein
MGSGRPSIAKRQRELKLIEKRKQKAERRAQRREEAKRKVGDEIVFDVSEIQSVPET